MTIVLIIIININIKVYGSTNNITTLDGTVQFLNQTIQINDGMYPDYGDDDSRWKYYGQEGFLDLGGMLTIQTYNIEDYGYCGYNTQYVTKPSFFDLINGKIKIYGDDPIINIVPRELFIHRGQYTYIGDDYGFFVKTTPYESSGTYSATNVVDVFIFDIILNYDSFGMTYTIKPLYTYTFIYISYFVFYHYGEIVFNDYNISLINTIGTTDVIIPWPECYGDLTSDFKGLGYSQNYSEAKRNNDLYAIKDPGVSVVLENENNLNMYDYGYDPSKDYGYRLTQTYITYSGKGLTYSPDLKMSKQWGYAAQFALAAAGLGLTVATGGAGILFYTSIGISTAGLAITTYDWISYINSAHQASWIMTEPANHMTDDSRGSSYEQQSEWFTSRNLEPQLWKVDGKRLLTEINDPLIFPIKFEDQNGNERQGETNFVFNYSSAQSSEARLHYSSCLEIVQVNETNCIILGEATHGSFINIGNKITKTMDLDSEIDGYTLYNGFDSFSYIPSYSGEYTFNSSLSYARIQLLKGNQTLVSENIGSLKFKLEKNVEYKFIVKFNTTAKSTRFAASISPTLFQDSVNLDLDNYILNNSTEILVKYKTKTSGFYNMSIAFQLTSGNYPNYNSNIFKIYDEFFNIIEKVPFIDTNYEASNIDNSNSLVTYLNSNTIYYIVVVYPVDISNINLKINLIYNLLSLDDTNSQEQSESTIVGDKFYIFKIPYTGRYNFTVEGNSGSSHMKLFILKKEGLNYISLDENLIYQGTGVAQKNANFNKNDELFIGYINSDNEYGSIIITVYEDPLMTFNVMTDPNLVGIVLGTEVTVNQKGYYGLTVAKGFTRCIYLCSDALYSSRLDYNWESTNPNVATVSTYGTITGKSPGTTIIRVTDKYNQGHLATIIITVYLQEPQVVPEVRLTTYMNEDPSLDGTEVRFNNGIRGEITIHQSYTRSICIVGNGPTNIRQDYIWQSSNSSIASVNQYGIVTGYKAGTVTITCINKANPSYVGSITIIIL